MDINSLTNVEMSFSPDKPRATSQQGVRIIARLCSWLFILLFTSSVYATDVDINIIIQIESGGNPNAYNYKTTARGLLQITEICLKDFNECFHFADKEFINGEFVLWIDFIKLGQKVNIEELYEPSKNIIIGSWYMNIRIPQMLRAYKIPDTIDNRLWAYNAGIGNVKKGIKPRETKNYIIKYHRLERGK